MALEVRCVKAADIFHKNYSYLVFDTDSRDGVIVDPAGDLEQIQSLVSGLRVNLGKVLLTHCHYDHTGLANALAQGNGVQVLMSRAEIEYYGFSCSNLSSVEESHPMLVGRHEIHPISTPGHTKGSACYLIGGNLFTGDTLFIEGCGLCSGRGADPVDMFNSLHQLKSLIDLDTLVYPGHSYGQEPGKTFGYLLRNNIYLLLENRDHFVTFRMRENQRKVYDFR